MELSIGCHVSTSGGLWNAPKNAKELGCETFQMFTRSPMGGTPPKLDEETVGRFKAEMEKYFPEQKPLPTSPSAKGRGTLETPSFQKRGQGEFVVHCPYFVNFGSKEARIYHGSISVVTTELERSNVLGARYVMTHLGSAKDLGQKEAFKQTKAGLVEVLEEYEGETQFLLEIAAGAGEIIGDTFEELAELMEPLVKFKTFGGICFDTQHAFSSGYDLRTPEAVVDTFRQFDKVIGLKYLRMSHINDSKIELGGRKDRHEHIGQGLIGEDGFRALLQFCQRSIVKGQLSASLPLILETEHDTVEKDIKLLKSLRDSLEK